MAALALPGYDCPLTPRQLAIVKLMPDGLTYKEIGRRLGITASTVRSHLNGAYNMVAIHPEGGRGGSSGVALFVQCLNAGWLDAVALDPDPLRHADRRVTWSQRLYLEAFDQHIRAWAAYDEAGERRTRRMMDDALAGVLGEAGAHPADRRDRGDPLKRMAATLTRHF